MTLIDRLWLATLTKNNNDADTDAGRLNVTINIDGEDVLDRDFDFLNGSGWLSSGLGPDSAWLGEGEAALSDQKLADAIQIGGLTNSSIRVGIRSDDMWAPFHALVLAQTERRIIALAMETEIDATLSTDPDEGKLTMPLRLVADGSSTTQIHRVLLLVYTGGGSDVETDSDIQLQITAGGAFVVNQQIPQGPRENLEEYTANWYVVDSAPFTRSDVLSNGEVRLAILGSDAWRPASVFVLGLDTPSGRPNAVVHLAALPDWGEGVLSSDPQEGNQSVALPLA